jgi:hypothetical protein
MSRDASEIIDVLLSFYYSFKILHFCKATHTWDVTSGRDIKKYCSNSAITLVAQKQCEKICEIK